MPSNLSRDVKRIESAQQLAEFADKHRIRNDWHEPDEQNITAIVLGTCFDNAMGPGETFGYETSPSMEIAVYLCEDLGEGREPRPLACVNLASLCAWATEDYRI